MRQFAQCAQSRIPSNTIDCWQSWPYPGRCVVCGRRTATRVHVCEVRGDGVANSAGPAEALANRRYGIKGGVSAGGSRITGVGSVEKNSKRQSVYSPGPLLTGLAL